MIKPINLRICLGLVLLVLLYCFPLILSNRYFLDDMIRSVYGVTSWNADGRPVADMLFRYLTGRTDRTADMAPLPLFLGILFFSYTAMIWMQRHVSEHLEWIHMFTCFLLFSCPLMLYCFANRFDVLTKMLSLGAGFILQMKPVQTKDRSSERLFLPEDFFWILVSTALSVFICCTYQVSLGFALSISVLTVFVKYMNENLDKTDIIGELEIFFGIATGAVIYRYFIAPRFLNYEGWQGNASAVIPLSGNFISAVWHNIKDILRFCLDYFRNFPIIPRWIYGICGFVLMILFCIKYWQKPAKVIFSLLALIAIFSLSISPLLILANPGIKARELLSFTALSLFFGIIILFVYDSNKVILCSCLALVFLFRFSFMNIWGNAMNAQKEYEQYLTYMICRDIEQANADGRFDSIHFEGDTPRSPEFSSLSWDYPELNDLVPVYINNSDWIGGIQLLRFTELYRIEPSMSEAYKEYPCLFQNSLYSGYGVDNTIVILFKPAGE